jgi:hypothetical protein
MFPRQPPQLQPRPQTQPQPRASRVLVPVYCPRVSLPNHPLQHDQITYPNRPDTPPLPPHEPPTSSRTVRHVADPRIRSAGASRSPPNTPIDQVPTPTFPPSSGSRPSPTKGEFRFSRPQIFAGMNFYVEPLRPSPEAGPSTLKPPIPPTQPWTEDDFRIRIKVSPAGCNFVCLNVSDDVVEKRWQYICRPQRPCGLSHHPALDSLCER